MVLMSEKVSQNFEHMLGVLRALPFSYKWTVIQNRHTDSVERYITAVFCLCQTKTPSHPIPSSLITLVFLNVGYRDTKPFGKYIPLIL